MVQQIRDGEYLDFSLAGVDDRVDALPPAKMQCSIVVRKGLLDNKKERYSIGPEEQQQSDGAHFS